MRRTCSTWFSSLPDSSAARDSPTSRSAAASVCLREGQRRLRLAARALELVQRDLALGAGLAPLALLRGEGDHVRVEVGELARERLAGALRLGPHRRGPREPLLGRAQTAGDVRLLHLPVDPLLPGRFLLALQLGQPARADPRS